MIITERDINLAKLIAGKLPGKNAEKKKINRIVNRHEYELDGVPCRVDDLVAACKFHLSYEAIRRRIKDSGMNGREAITFESVAEWRKLKEIKA